MCDRKRPTLVILIDLHLGKWSVLIYIKIECCFPSIPHVVRIFILIDMAQFYRLIYIIAKFDRIKLSVVYCEHTLVRILTESLCRGVATGVTRRWGCDPPPPSHYSKHLKVLLLVKGNTESKCANI